MKPDIRFLLLTALLAIAWNPAAQAAKKTVCTITVNSADEKETFRAHLPPDRFQFVELVERGRADWLESACRKGVQCDVLVISGHYDGGNEFFSDQLDAREFLPVDEMERVSCSNSCPGLFSRLKEVYLFGCDTLNAGAVRSASAEIGRSLIRSGHSKAEAERATRALSVRHAESSRDRMRLVFPDIPAIYGFSSVAPLGPSAAATLRAHFKSAGTGEVGTGRPSGRLLSRFASNSMVVTSGMSGADLQAAHRKDVCQFADDRLSSVQKLGFVHQLLNREAAESRMFLDRIERFSASLSKNELHSPEVSTAIDRIARDDKARDRYLAFARDADEPVIRARMIEVAHGLGWLTKAERRSELRQLIGAQLASSAPTAADVDLACRLNRDGDLQEDGEHVRGAPAMSGKVAHAAILACLGSTDDRARVLEGLTSSSDADVQIAQVFLRHRPLAVAELREVTSGIARMSVPAAKVRALETLAGHRVSDRETLGEIARLFPVAETAGVQMAIAGVLIRSDYTSIDKFDLVQTLQQHRIKSSEGANMIDALIRRLQM